MFETKKVIPSLAVAGLMLSGCGDDDASVQDIINQYCEKGDACEAWAEAECQDDMSEFALDDECDDAYLDLMECYGKLNCVEFDEGILSSDTDDCEDEFDVFASECL